MNQIRAVPMVTEALFSVRQGFLLPDGKADTVPIPDETAVSRVRWLSSLLNPWAVRAAATLRLPDLIGTGTVSTAELADRAGADPDALARLLRHLALLDVVRAVGENRWQLGELGPVLREEHPAQLCRNLDQDDRYLGTVDANTSGLLAAVRSGASAWPGLRGVTFWEESARDPEFGSRFDALMDHYSRRLGPALAAGYPWSQVRRVVDVGGGAGRVLASVLAAHPRLQGTLLDLAGAVSGARPVLDEAEVTDRCTVVAGSFFAELPTGGQVYLLVNVVHNWDDADSTRILRGCAQAAAPQGRVVLVERLVPDDAGADERFMASSKDLYMLLLLGGRERTEREHHALAADAGLAHEGTRVLAGNPDLSVLEYSVAR